MDFKKSKVLLKKINAIYESGEAFNHEFSALERDLLLQYLRAFYECVADSKEEVKVEQVSVKTAIPESKPQPTTMTTTQRPEPIQRVVQEVSVASNSNGRHDTYEKSLPAVEIKEESKIADVDQDVEALFEQEALNDLSNRFANSPINDIAKAMGINERILTINELFGGDQQAFLSIIGRLNNAENFEQAKHILTQDVVGRFQWTKGNRSKKAKIFVQLVRRRFL